MGPGFRTTFTASITLLRTTLFATETAISRSGLQSVTAGPHYLQLTGAHSGSATPLLPCLGEVSPSTQGK